MNVIKNEVEEIKLESRGKKMEYCGRVCYKSDSNISDVSYVKFLQNISKSGHTSVLEHERIIFKVDSSYRNNLGLNSVKFFTITDKGAYFIISGNIRAWLQNCNSSSIFYSFLKQEYPFLFESEGIGLVKYVTILSEKDLEKEDLKYHDSKTFKILCSRACSHQLVRHRAFSFSQQSQRYCNFSGKKFGHSIDFILPIYDDKKEFSEEQKSEINKYYNQYFQQIENHYFSLIDMGLRAEDARTVLPNAASTVIVMTGTTKDWEGFFELRCDTHAQREIRDVANLIKNNLGV